MVLVTTNYKVLRKYIKNNGALATQYLLYVVTEDFECKLFV